MNAPFLHRAILRRHVAQIEERYPLAVLGLLPRGAAAHVAGEEAVDLLAEKRHGLDLLSLCEAEADLGELIGRPVGIVLTTGLDAGEADAFRNAVEPL